MKSQYNQYPYYNDYSNITAPLPVPENFGTSSQNLTSIERLYKFDSIVKKYEINPYHSIKLRQLEGFEIVIICDDSGSMSNPVTNPSITNHLNLPSRWDELKKTVTTIIEIAGVLDKTGVDVYFLNRPGLKNVNDVSQINSYFEQEPSGYTPIVKVFSQVLQDMQPILSEKKLLIILATDGEPTTENGQTIMCGITEKQRFHNLLKTRSPIEKIYTTILACTDDDSVIAYLQNWDVEIPNLDVVDDFYTVKNNVQKKQGITYGFSFGDYIVKVLLGSMDKFFDEIDEIDEIDEKISNTSCIIS
jgi:hypothetical protein